MMERRGLSKEGYYLFVIILLVLIFFVMFSFTQKDLPPEPIIMYPKNGSSLNFTNLIILDELTREEDLASVSIEYKSIEDSGWKTLTGPNDPVSTLYFDYYRALWDISDLFEGIYKIRVFVEDENGQVGEDEAIVELASIPLLKQEQDTSGFCGCEEIRIVATDRAVGGVTFIPEDAFENGNDTLGPNLDKDNMRYNFMVEADLEAGSKPIKCVEWQRVKGNFTYEGFSRPLNDSDGINFSYEGSERMYDGYISQGIVDGHYYKKYSDDRSHIRWVDAPGLKNRSLFLDGNNPAGFQVSFLAEILGTSGHKSCNCTWDVEGELYPNGSVKTMPHIFNGPNCSSWF